MKNYSNLLLTAIVVIVVMSCTVVESKWITEKKSDYTIFFTNEDKQNIKEYKLYFSNGKKSVTDFFQGSYKNDFDIRIHPNRTSLDSTWQKDWGMPEFKSECWMVASGVAHKLDIISPAKWDSLACEHTYADKIEIQRLITHELVHVFHGQHNISPDFSDVTGIDWFVEGMATYASGQCDSTRISEVNNAIHEHNIPQNLSDFWTGNLKYGLSGTVVMYLDSEYGREKLMELLKYNTIDQIFSTLNINESEILTGWNAYMKKL